MHRAVHPDRKTTTSSSHVNVVKETIGNATRESDTSLTFSVDKKKLKVNLCAYHLSSISSKCYRCTAATPSTATLAVSSTAERLLDMFLA